jgi:hypothetical protein
LALVGAALTVGMPTAPATAAPATSMASGAAIRLTSLSVSPDRGLVDGQKVTVRISGGSYGTTYAVAECDLAAFIFLAEPSASPQDVCDSRHDAVVTVAANGTASGSLSLPAVLTTALGGVDCRKASCYLAVDALHSTGGAPVLVKELSFAADACAAAGSCQTPVDAWDPSLGPPPAASPVHANDAAALGATAAGVGGSVTEANPVVVPLQPTVAGDLTIPGSVTGPFDGQALAGTDPTSTTTATTTAATTTAATSTTSTTSTTATTSTTSATTTRPTAPVQGEGLLRLALEAPGTSWGPGQPSSTVVDATLTDVTTHQLVGTQQFVLFWGAAPFVYAGFAGPVRTSDHYSVKISVEAPASQGGLSQPAPGARPQIVLLARALEVVGTTNPEYLAYAYAPVMYGRSTSALHDVPLLMYADVSLEAGGTSAVSYTIVWSHEDAGTGFLPFLEWGRWGRMTDIENAISFTVSPNGTVSRAKYLWGGEPPTGFPDSQTALKEVDEPFAGTWWGHHPVFRDATGNNDFSDHGTTPFRFQLAPVAAPPANQTREAVMGSNPFTYQVMAEEVARWYADISTSPSSPEPGQAEQYAIVDLDTSGKGVSSVGVDVRLAGYPQWFRSDLGWGFPLVSTGHVRTVVKLPVGWPSSRIIGVQVAVEPPSAAPSLTVHSLQIERFTGTAIEQVPAPTALVGPEALDVAPS